MAKFIVMIQREERCLVEVEALDAGDACESAYNRACGEGESIPETDWQPHSMEVMSVEEV